eukprot:scaffold53_cov193-Pinguiococcus_pyrenoidosus.AAC.30
MFPDRNPAQLTAPSFRSNKEDAKGHRKAAKSMWAVHAMRSLEDADPEEGEQDESTPAAPHEEGTPSPPKAPRPSAAELLAMSPPYPVPDGQNPNQAKKARRRVTLAGPEARQIAEVHCVDSLGTKRGRERRSTHCSEASVLTWPLTTRNTAARIRSRSFSTIRRQRRWGIRGSC